MSTPAPVIGSAPKEYDAQSFNMFFGTLRSYFSRLAQVQPVTAATLNIDIGTLPTDASLATLRSGDVYRDTTAGNVLKIKP